jgi:hypothetical protein
MKRTWVFFAVGAAILVGVVGALTFILHRAAVHPGFTPSVAAADWQPNKAYYCAGIGQLEGASALYIATVANAAPTKTSHHAMVTLYRDVTHSRPTAGDIAAVMASYECGVNP